MAAIEDARRSSPGPKLARGTLIPESSVSAALPVPLRELCDLHEREWLLVKILDPAAPAGDAPSILLALGTDWAVMFRLQRKVRNRDPRALFSIVGGGMKFGDGQALREALARIAAEEDWVSVNPW